MAITPTSILYQKKHFLFSLGPSPSLFASLNSLHLHTPLSYCSSSYHSSQLSSSSSSLSRLNNSQQQRCQQQLRRVSTATVEYETPTPGFDFRSEISRLKTLLSQLVVSRDLREKDSVIDADSRVRRFFSENRGFARVLASVDLSSRELFLVKCLVAAGQEHALSLGYEEEFEEVGDYSVGSSVKSALYALVEMIERFDISNVGGLGRQNGVVLGDEEVGELQKFLKFLGEIEQFYSCFGGIIGYQIMVLELLARSSKTQGTNQSQLVTESMDCQYLEIHPPNVIDLTQNKEYASQAALWGIEGLPDLGEIYPLGGAADRLGLVDPETGECLPAAMLPYCGRTLLEVLIRDLQAREFLYFKLYGKQCITPVAIMTSSAKNNHDHVTSLCERLRWFGRGRSSFQLFEQPLVPTISAEDGQWIVSKPFAPVCKPGGHGVIWKLAYDKGIFQWFYDHGRKGATVRQVSNVVAATDLTVLALAGIGLRHKKKLGFASCQRNVGATEGINVLIEKKNLDGKWAYGISCIEYTEFDKFGITSGPLSSNSFQAEFPANTNILYVDLPSAELVGSSNNAKSLPNMVLNTKKQIEYVDQYGDYHSVWGGRLECTMQNIADNFFNTFSSRHYHGIEVADDLDTFIVYNERRRVTSSAKKKRKHPNMSLHQTPDGALLDILRNAYDLLSQCDVKLPKIEGNDKYVDLGPPYMILLHPALGPLWEVTRQKFNGGSISKGSELQLEVSEFLWSDVQVDGSLSIVAESVMGSTRINENDEPMLQYGHRCGKCKLRNVKVLNKGIDWSRKENVYWKHDVHRFEACKVILHGNAEFEASDVTLQGNHVFEVPDGCKLKITSGSQGLTVNTEPFQQELMDSGTWYWNYKVNGTRIQLELVELQGLTE